MDRREFIGWVAGSAGLAAAPAIGWGLPTSPKIKWFNELKPAHKVAVQLDKPLLIVFSASWCTYCHKLLRESLSDRKMVTWVTANFVPVLLDFDEDKPIAEVLKVESLPCTVVLSPQADLLLQHNGFQKTDPYRETLQAALDKRTEIQQVRGGGR